MTYSAAAMAPDPLRQQASILSFGLLDERDSAPEEADGDALLPWAEPAPGIPALVGGGKPAALAPHQASISSLPTRCSAISRMRAAFGMRLAAPILM